MANEIKITELTVKKHDGQWQIYSNKIPAAQSIDSGATNNSAALNTDTDMIRVVNTGIAGYIKVSDDGAAVTAANGMYVKQDEVVDIQVERGRDQIVGWFDT